MDMDESIWILEFLLRQSSIDDKTLLNLINVLPIPTNNPTLNKTLILRQLESAIQQGTISLHTIQLLEQLELLNHPEGASEVSEATKTAYSTLAMHYTAKLIQQIAGDKKVKYATAVKRFWSARVCEMEMRGVRLVYDDLVHWVRDVEAGVLDVDVCENVLRRYTELDVVTGAGMYLNEVKEKMGPSFLELSCQVILSDDGLSKTFGLDGVSELRRGPDNVNALSDHEDEASRLSNQSKDNAPTVYGVANSKANDVSKAHVPPKHKHVVSRRSRGAKIVDPMETSHDKYDCIPGGPEVSKVQKAPESSSFELHASMKDPLPDALRLAESQKVSTSGENEARDLVGGNLTGVNDKTPNSSDDMKGKALEANGNDHTVKDQTRIKPSLFERNHTAHTTEWSDAIDTFEDGSPTRPHLASPQKRKVPPLSVHKMEKLAKQRKKKRWTPLEEDTLRTGVQRHGKGNWKLILSMYREIFKDRTEVDLKDKWRNLTR